MIKGIGFEISDYVIDAYREYTKNMFNALSVAAIKDQRVWAITGVGNATTLAFQFASDCLSSYVVNHPNKAELIAQVHPSDVLLLAAMILSDAKEGMIVTEEGLDEATGALDKFMAERAKK